MANDPSRDAQPIDDGVIENAGAGRFELRVAGDVVSVATFRQVGSTVVVPHVETAVEHRGNGHAARLMEGLLALLRADGRTIEPLCPFAADHIRAQPRHHDLVATAES